MRSALPCSCGLLYQHSSLCDHARALGTAEGQFCWSIPSGGVSCMAGLLSYSASVVGKTSLILRCSSVAPVFTYSAQAEKCSHLAQTTATTCSELCLQSPAMIFLSAAAKTPHKTQKSDSKTGQKGWPGCQSWEPVLLPVLVHPETAGCGDIQSKV